MAVGGTERVTYEDYYAGTVETDSEVVYLFDNTCNIWRLNVWDAGDGQYVAYDYLYSVTPTDLHVTFSAGSYAGYSSLVVGSDGALYLSAFTGKYSELYRLVYDELTATYVSTALGTFGRDIWPASCCMSPPTLPPPKRPLWQPCGLTAPSRSIWRMLWRNPPPPAA